jgi:hypothetical protein
MRGSSSAGRMGFEHQAHHRAQAGGLDEAWLTQFVRRRGRKGAAPDARLCRELNGCETFPPPPLGSQMANGAQSHASVI